ncbi:MAG: type II CAAX endopeptidase family protein [Pirellulales bacterium]
MSQVLNSEMLVEPLAASATAPSATTPAASPEQPAKPRVWTVFAAYVVASIGGVAGIVLANAAVGVCVGVADSVHGRDAEFIQTHIQQILRHPLAALFAQLLPYQLGMLAVALFAAWMSPHPWKERLGLVKAVGGEPSGLNLAGLGAFTVATALSTAVALSLIAGPPAAAESMAGAESTGAWWLVAAANFAVMLVPAFVEECFFRGYIQRRLLERWSPFAAISTTTGLFAILHCDSLHHVLAVVPLGIVTGVLAYRTQSVRAGIVVHAVHNLAAVGYGVYAAELGGNLSSDALGMALVGLIASLLLAGLVALTCFVRTRRPTSPLSPSLAGSLAA